MRSFHEIISWKYDANSVKQSGRSLRKPESLSRGLTDRAVLRTEPSVQSASGLGSERASISGTSEKEDFLAQALNRLRSHTNELQCKPGMF